MTILIKKYYADWCHPCTAMSAKLVRLAQVYDFELENIDIEKNAEAVQAAGVRSIPTLEIFKDGELKEKLTGTLSETLIGNILRELHAS